MFALLIVTTWVAASGASSGHGVLQSVVLDAGTPVVRSIAAGESHSFELRLDAEQTALVEIEERGIDVILEAAEPNGTTIARAGDRLGGQDRTQVAVAAESTGRFI